MAEGSFSARSLTSGGLMKMKWNIAVVLILFALPFVSCHHKKKESIFDVGKKSDSELYQLGQQYMAKKNWPKARDTFKVVFENFPKSDYRILSKLAYADCYYKEGGDANYLLAITEYQDFISLFPFSPKAEYAQFQVGMSYYHMMERADRDQTNTHKALDEFRKVLDNYPKGEHYQEAYDKLLSCYTRLADHDYGIAHYYERTGKYGAAVERVKALLKAYPEAVHSSAHYYTLAHSLEELRQYPESCSYYAKILEKWPKSDEASNAKSHESKVCGSTQTQQISTQ
ncbi:MAG: hypothetical protein C5B54_07700 [Acidobacteria bacterium]|nr:MAG: hypothetical protein C5B54_07700 [Acidobacteriota bacterium]